MFKSLLLPWKRTKTKVMVPEQTMEDEQIQAEQRLVPCNICSRTFLPQALKKHGPICEKNSQKKRKVFDSLKQRVEGTDLAQFHQKSYLKRQESAPKTTEKIARKSPSKWEESHQKLVDAIRTAKGASREMSSSNNKKHQQPSSTNERCPHCERQFGPKAFDRHVEWCKEHTRTRIQKSPASVLLAKERLEARTKYKVPPLTKSKRSLVKEKYSNNAMNRTESVFSVKSTPSLRNNVKKPKSVLDLGNKVEEVVKIDKTNSVMNLNDMKKQSREVNKSLRTKRFCPHEKVNSVKINENLESITVSPMKLANFPSVKKLVTWKEIGKKAPTEDETVVVVYENSKVFSKKKNDSPKVSSRSKKFLKNIKDILSDSDEDVKQSSNKSSSSNSFSVVNETSCLSHLESPGADDLFSDHDHVSIVDPDRTSRNDLFETDSISLMLNDNNNNASKVQMSCEHLVFGEATIIQTPVAVDIVNKKSDSNVDSNNHLKTVDETDDITEFFKTLVIPERVQNRDLSETQLDSEQLLLNCEESATPTLHSDMKKHSINERKFISIPTGRFEEINVLEIDNNFDNDLLLDEAIELSNYDSEKTIEKRCEIINDPPLDQSENESKFTLDLEAGSNCHNMQKNILETNDPSEENNDQNSINTDDCNSLSAISSISSCIAEKYQQEQRNDNMNFNSINFLFNKENKDGSLESILEYQVPKKRRKLNTTFILENKENELFNQKEQKHSANSEKSVCILPKITKRSPKIIEKHPDTPSIEWALNERRSTGRILEARSKKKKKKIQITKDISSVFLNYQSDTKSYDPFLSAERQFMELLECDDFKPFETTQNPLLHTPRPHTVKKKSNTLKSCAKKSVKSAEPISDSKKRASVIDPPACFQDPEDEFEMLENLIKDHFNDDNTFFLDLNKRNKEELNVILNKERKYSDDMSSIDSNLINENDNLSIPEHFKMMGSYSPTDDTDTTIQNEDAYTRDRFSKRKMENKVQSGKNSKTKSKSGSSSGFVRESSKHENNSKTQEHKGSGSRRVEEYYIQSESRKSPTKLQMQLKPEETFDIAVKSEDLFTVDDKMYAEYKIYEEMYLKEKEKKTTTRKQKSKNTIKSYGIDIANEQNVSQSNKVSDDSAYGSLNRNTPKPKTAKLSPLQRKRIDSASSSGSENLMTSADISEQRMSKFCHECGNKYPLNTAKFCVECGVKRLVL